MSTVQEDRKRAYDELHAPGKEPIRLKVRAGGADLKEVIRGVARVLPAGEVFDHWAPKRVEQLLEIGLVERTKDRTKQELAAQKAVQDQAVSMLADEFREKAQRILKARGERMAKAEQGLRKMTPEILAAECKARALKDLAENDEAKIQACLADELEKIKASEK